MENDKQTVETSSSSPPPSKKIKLDYNKSNETENMANLDEPIIQPKKEVQNEISDPKKHPTDNDNPPSVPSKKLKQNDSPISSTDSANKTDILEKSTNKDDLNKDSKNTNDAKVSANLVTTCAASSGNKTANIKTEPSNANTKAESTAMETKTEKALEQPNPKIEENKEKMIDKKEISTLSATKENTLDTATASPDMKEPTPKPCPTKVLKKLPGLNPIRPMSAPLHVSTDNMAAPTSRAIVSPVQVSPGKSPTSPVNTGIRMSPVKQMGGATLSPVARMGPASISPIKNTSKSPVSHQKGVLNVSPIHNQKGVLSISPVRQVRNEVDMSPFLTGEVSISALTQQGVTITPAKPQLSAEIRSQIPEGISITAVPLSTGKTSMTTTPLAKAKSPIRHIPKPLSKVVSPPKPIAQHIQPQTQQIKKQVAVNTNVPKSIPTGLPKVNPSQTAIKQHPPIPSQSKSPVSEENPKIVSPSQKPKEIPPTNKEEKPAAKVDTTESKPKIPAPETKPNEIPSETNNVVRAVPKSVQQEDEPSDENKSKNSTEDKSNAEKAVENKTIEDQSNKDDKKEESSLDGESDEDNSSDTDSESEEEDAQSGKALHGTHKDKLAVTSTRSLRTRKPAAVDVAVKLTRIDDDLEDGALPPWNIKKHLVSKSEPNSDVESTGASDDNSNSQESKSAQSSSAPSTSGGGQVKRRGRPRKTLSPGSPQSELVEDYTGHDSLHEALKKIIADEGLGGSGGASESEEEEDPARRETKQLLSLIPFFSRRGGRAGVKGKAIGKNNQFDNRIVDRLESDRKFRNEMFKLYQEDVKKREEKKLERIAENRKKIDERNKALAERKEKLRVKAEERRRKYEEQKKQRLEEAKRRDEAKRLRASLAPPQSFDDDDTRMSFPRTPSTPAWKTSSKIEGMEDGDKSESRVKRAKMEIIDFDSQKEFPVHALAEYQWPLQGGEHFMIQEQVAAYLGVKSFKRKYPDLKRRGLEPEERTYICDSGLVSEAMMELGLTAVQSADIMDIMYVDFPEKYEEVKKFSREKQARELIDRQRAFYDTTISEQTAKDLKETLVEATSLWNAQFNKLRRETRQCALDLQTFVVHYPAKSNPKPMPKIGHYPVAILPGQYCDYYKQYTSTELKYMPLNTVLYGPLLPNEPYADELSCSDASSQSDSDDSDTSSSGSSSNNNSSSSGSEDSSSDDEDAPKPLPQTPAAPKRQPGTPGGRKANAVSLAPAETIPPVPVESASAEMKVEPVPELSKKPVPESRNCKACDRDETAGEMIRCGKCVRYLHPPCLDLPLDMLPHMKLYEWQCSDCKSCVTCQLAQDDDKMLFCDLCDRGYHNYCIGLDKIPTGRWHCKVCSVCSACNSTDPNPEWEHEMKKGPKGQSVYQRTLCTPCAKSGGDANQRPQRR